jgi:hypothetical protein
MVFTESFVSFDKRLCFEALDYDKTQEAHNINKDIVLKLKNNFLEIKYGSN